MQRCCFIYIADSQNNASGSYGLKNGHELYQFAAAVTKSCRYEHFKVVDLYNKSGITVRNAMKFKRLKDPVTSIYKNYEYPAYKGMILFLIQMIILIRWRQLIILMTACIHLIKDVKSLTIC